jgi:DNA-binding GntR family transcriptional regulator
MNRLREPVRADSLARQVYQILRQAIFEGSFPPGETLRELHLARSLNVSQATVREAIVQLEHAGLVVRLRNRKSEVTRFSRDEVRDRLSMRIVLEQMAAVRAAQRMTDADREELAGLSTALAAAIDSGDQMPVTEADVQFHRFIWEKSGSPVLYKTLDQLTTPLFAFLGVLAKIGMVDVRLSKSHDHLVSALSSGDEEVIRRAIHEHISGSYKGFLDSDAPSLNALVKAAEEVTLPPVRREEPVE